MQVTHVDDNVTHIVLGQKSSIGFTLAETPEFFQVLSKSLYTDPVLAMCRETVCNAWDAHIAAGITDTPIEISISDTEMIITDFGSGIPKNKIGEIYTVYGKSTKSHDGKQTGGFGLGCKSPFAYSDHFTVESSCEGFTTVYALSLSSGTSYGIPTLQEMVSFPAEKTGLSVRIPLHKDCANIRRIVTTVCHRGNIFAKLNGEELNRLSLPEDWGLLESMRSMPWSIRYGNVIYPVPVHPSLEAAWNICNTIRKELHIDGSHGLLMQAPPDSISVAPSREALTVSDTTVETLNLMAKQFKEFFESAIAQAITTHAENIKKLSSVSELLQYAFYGESAQRNKQIPSGIKSEKDLIKFIVYYHHSINGNAIMKRVNHLVWDRLQEIGFLSKEHLQVFQKTSFPLESYHQFFKQRFSYNPFRTGTYLPNRGIKNPLQVFHRTLLEKMARSSLVDLKKLYRFSAFSNSFVMYSLKEKAVSDVLPHEALLLARKQVIITRAKSTLDKKLEKFDEEYQDFKSAYLVYHVGTSKKEYDDVLEFFDKMQYDVIDFVPERGSTVQVKSTEPRAKKRIGFLQVTPSSMATDKHDICFYGQEANCLSKSENAAYIKQPDWVVKISPKQYQTSGVPRLNGISGLKDLLIGSTGGICLSAQKMNAAEKAAIPTLERFLVNKSIEIVKANSTEIAKIRAAARMKDSVNFYFMQLLQKYPHFMKYFNLEESTDSNLLTAIAVLERAARVPYSIIPRELLEEIQNLLGSINLSPKQEYLQNISHTSSLYQCINWYEMYAKYRHLSELPRDIRKIISFVLTNGA